MPAPITRMNAEQVATFAEARRKAWSERHGIPVITQQPGEPEAVKAVGRFLRAAWGYGAKRPR